MAQLSILVIAWILGAAAGALLPPVVEESDCCLEKTVGGVSYALVREADTSGYNCLANCIYQKNEGGGMFCFAAGDLEVVCGDDGEFTDMPPMGCKCGIKKTQRIVGGQETEVNEYPWMAAIADEDENFSCGSTLIGDRWVVTASHCLFAGGQALVATELRIILGDHDIAVTTESQIPRKTVLVSKIILHEDYDDNAGDFYNDIALLQLAEAVDLNVYTPACVAETGDSFVGKNAWVYGWGATSLGGITSEKLLEVEVPVVSTEVCKLAMGDDAITAGMLCAGGLEGKDSCQGDSGGPLTVDVTGQQTLVGDVSWGNGCALEGQYGVYAETAFYRSWIDNNIEANGGISYCPNLI